MKEISDDLVKVTHKWLGKVGLDFFKGIQKEHGTINAVWSEGGIPHPVHLREGMQIRNFMRGTDLCKDWGDHDYDDNWIPLIEKVLQYE